MTRSALAEKIGTSRIQLPMCELDRDSWVPLYHQIKVWLLNTIANGRLATGDLLPSEDWIERSTGVSRMTVRQAVNDLRVQGFVVSARGSGTFVAPGAQKRAHDLLEH